MHFNQTWTQFALDAEVDHYGTKRIADAHNALRRERDALLAERDRYREAFAAERETRQNVDAQLEAALAGMQAQEASDG